MVEPAINGTPFTAWVIAPIYVAVYVSILLAVEYFRRRKNKNVEPHPISIPTAEEK